MQLYQRKINVQKLNQSDLTTNFNRSTEIIIFIREEDLSTTKLKV